MKSYLIMSLTILMTGLFASYTEPATGWSYDQSTQQAFYMLEDLTIDDETAEGDGTGWGGETCYVSGECDVVGAFIDRDGEEICVGWRYADASENTTTIPLMGYDGTDATPWYLTSGEPAYLKVYDASNGSILSVNPGIDLPGWSINAIFLITGTSTANNVLGCTDESACNYDSNATGNDGSCASLDCADECGGSAEVDDCGVCGGGNADMDCADVCFGYSVNTWCDDECGETGPVDDDCGECGGDSSSCTGCTNSDAGNYNGDTIDDGSCEFTVTRVDDLAAAPGENRVFLTWSQPEDDFENDDGNYSYDVYMDGSYHSISSTAGTTIYDLTAGQQYSFYVIAMHEYGSSEASDPVYETPSEPTGLPVWRLQLVAEIDSYEQFENTGNPSWLLSDDQNFLGAATDGSWGYDEDHDIPEPPVGPSSYISLFFDHPEWDADDWGAHFTEDIVLDNDDFFSHNLTQWNGTVVSNVPGTTTITFSVNEGPIPANYEMYVELDGEFTRITNDDSETTVSFYMDGSGHKDFSVTIGNIVPQAPAGLTAADDGDRSIELNWDADDLDPNRDLGTLRARYPATSYNVYRDGEPNDPNINQNDAGDDHQPNVSHLPGGCGLLTGDGQSGTTYPDAADIYGLGEGLLYESHYDYVVTGSNGAGESSEGYIVRLSGRHNHSLDWNNGDQSPTDATTADNFNPDAETDWVESDDDDIDGNVADGTYRIPHNYSPDLNPITIHISGANSFDEDAPYNITRYTWTHKDGDGNNLSTLSGTDTDDLYFTVTNEHETDDDDYTFNLHVASDYPVKDDVTCDDWSYRIDTRENNEDISITVEEEPNADPVASSALGLIRAGDGLSVVTSDNYDDSDFNDYDGNPGNPDDDIDASGDQVWYAPHDNMGDENPADLWFSADESDDADGECEDGGFGDDQTCDHQTYVWTGVMATDIGFDFEDLNGDGQYNYGEPFSLMGNEGTTFADINLGDYFAAGGYSVSLNSPEDLENCSNCDPGVYSTSVNAETGLSTLADCEDEDGNWTDNCGAFNYNGRDAHISMYGGGDDSIVILTMTVTDIYGDSDQTSLIISVEKERNEGPSVGQHRQQGKDDAGIYYMRTDEGTRDVYIGDQDGSDYDDCDDLWADDNDNDTQIYTWEYDGPGAFDAAGNDFDMSSFNSSYNHDRQDNVRDNHSWNDVEAWLEEGDHTFTFTTEDPYGESASSSTTFKIADEPGAPEPSINIDHTGLRYVVISVWDNAWEDDDFVDDECHGDVWHGAGNYPLYNTSEIALENGGNEIALWVDDDNSGPNTWTHVDESLDDETNYTYTVKAWNSELANQMDAVLENSESTKTHDRPDVLVLSPNGAEIRSVNDENANYDTVNDDFNVDFVTYFDDNDNGQYDAGEETSGQYISHIDVSYMPDGSSAEEGENSAGELVSTHNGGNSEGCSNANGSGDSSSDDAADATDCHQGDPTLQYFIADNDKNGVDVNYNAKVRVCVTDVGDFNGDGFETYCDDSDNPFTMASHVLHHEFSNGWHLFGPALEIYNEELDLVTHLEAPDPEIFSNMGNWGQDWVAYDVGGTYDGLTLNLGEGYYLAVANGATMEVRGNPVIGDPVSSGGDLSLDKGWNLIANPLVNKIAKDSLTINDGSGDLLFEDAVDAGWIAPTIYGWFENAYSPIDRLLHFGGYWVNTSRDLTIKVRPHLFEDGELTRKVENMAGKLEIKARDISGDGSSDFVTIGIDENANNEFTYGEDEYDLPRQAYASMGGEYIDLKIGTDLMKDIRSAEYDEFHAWNLTIENEKVDNNIEIAWGDLSAFEDDIHLVINGEAIDMHQESTLEISSNINEFAVVVGNIDSYLNPIPDAFGLGAAYPNPFNPVTKLDLALNVEGYVNMSVFNIRGQVVEVLVDRNMNAGYHNITWNADGISSGMYFVKVETGTNAAIQKLMLLK